MNERDLASLIIPHTLDDPVTFHRLAQVSWRFNEVSKTKLVKKQHTNTDDETEICTALPDGRRHGLSRVWYPNGQLKWSHHFHEGFHHGTCIKYSEHGEIIWDRIVKYENPLTFGYVIDHDELLQSLIW